MLGENRVVNWWCAQSMSAQPHTQSPITRTSLVPSSFISPFPPSLCSASTTTQSTVVLQPRRGITELLRTSFKGLFQLSGLQRFRPPLSRKQRSEKRSSINL